MKLQYVYFCVNDKDNSGNIGLISAVYYSP